MPLIQPWPAHLGSLLGPAAAPRALGASRAGRLCSIRLCDCGKSPSPFQLCDACNTIAAFDAAAAFTAPSYCSLPSPTCSPLSDLLKLPLKPSPPPPSPSSSRAKATLTVTTSLRADRCFRPSFLVGAIAGICVCMCERLRR